jgi:hypothetical protein
MVVRILPADAAGTVGSVALVLVPWIFLYLLSIFLYAEPTLGGKPMGFPPRLFTLPVRTSFLVVWPMLYGMTAVVLLWLWLTGLVLIPCGRAQTISWWPAFAMAAYLACTQAVCWTFVRTPLLRLVVVILVLPSAALGVILVWANYNLQVTTTHVAVGLSAVVVLSYVAAVGGVARDRRGDRFDWAWLGSWLLRAVPSWSCRQRTFASAQAAQRWLEVRRHAWLLPMFVGLFLLLLLFWGAALPLGPQEVVRVVAAILGFPCVLAFVIGFGMGKTSFWAGNLDLSSFTATRPLSSTGLANAKLYAAGLGALASWGLILVLSPLWVVLSGNAAVIQMQGNTLFHGQPAWYLAVLGFLASAGLVGFTWLQLVAGMCLSLTGRSWIVNGVVLLYGTCATALAILGAGTMYDGEFFAVLLIVLWCLGIGLALLKFGITTWLWRGPGRAADGKVWRLALWLSIAACLLTLLYAVFPDGPLPAHLAALYVLLALPLARLIGLPAAVAWNRHR